MSSIGRGSGNVCVTECVGSACLIVVLFAFLFLFFKGQKRVATTRGVAVTALADRGGCYELLPFEEKEKDDDDDHDDDDGDGSHAS